MDPRKKEIKRILSGIVINNGSYIAEAESIFKMNFNGVFSGAFSVRLFGVSERKKTYVINDESVNVPEVCVRSLDFIGKPVMLMNSPDEAAAMAFPYFFSPYIMTVAFDGNKADVGFYTSRSLISFVKARLGFKRFRKWTGCKRIEELGKKEKKKEKEKEN